MPLSSVGEGRVLTGLLTGSIYVSLHTGDPGTDGSNEVSGGSYAREVATFTQTGNNPTVAANDAVIQFTPATAGWGTITHFGLWSAVSSGDFIGGDALDVSKDVATGDIARWEIGNLTVESD